MFSIFWRVMAGALFLAYMGCEFLSYQAAAARLARVATVYFLFVMCVDQLSWGDSDKVESKDESSSENE